MKDEKRKNKALVVIIAVAFVLLVASSAYLLLYDKIDFGCDAEEEKYVVPLVYAEFDDGVSKRYAMYDSEKEIYYDWDEEVIYSFTYEIFYQENDTRTGDKSAQPQIIRGDAVGAHRIVAVTPDAEFTLIIHIAESPYT